MMKQPSSPSLEGDSTPPSPTISSPAKLPSAMDHKHQSQQRQQIHEQISAHSRHKKIRSDKQQKKQKQRPSARSRTPPRRDSTFTVSEAEDDDGVDAEPTVEHGHKKTNIEQVLGQLRDDIVPLNRNTREGKAKWRAMVENMQQGQTTAGGVGGGDEAHSHLRIEDELHGHSHHERVDTSQVGADIYSNRWKKITRYRAALQKPTKKGQTSSEPEPNNNSSTSQWKGSRTNEPSKDNGFADAFEDEDSSAGCLYKLTHYFSGILAGLLLWSALFAISNVGGDSTLVKGSAFLTVSSITTTSVVLIMVVGFINSAFTLQGTISDFERFLYHAIPVLLILITHYIGKAFELRRIECGALFRLQPDNRVKVHESYSCERIGYNQTTTSGADHDVGFIFLHVLPWLAAMGIYSYLHLAPPSAATRVQRIHQR